MSEQSISGPPRSFLIISIVALIWNLLGVASFIMQVPMRSEMLANLEEAQRALYQSMPMWVDGAFAIAVFGGLLASVGLVMKKAWCVPVFIVSLAAIIVQFGYWLLIADTIEVMGIEAAYLPLLITAIAIFLVWYSRDAKSKDWLS